jgi:hypothetical protein
MPIVIAGVALDCRDAFATGQFWSAALDRPLDPGASNEFASIGFDGRRTKKDWAEATELTWIFARVPEPKHAKNRLHLDVIAPDLEEEIARLVTLGARRVYDSDEHGYSWTLMTDPEGNEFDIATTS